MSVFSFKFSLCSMIQILTLKKSLFSRFKNPVQQFITGSSNWNRREGVWPVVSWKERVQNWSLGNNHSSILHLYSLWLPVCCSAQEPQQPYLLHCAITYTTITHYQELNWLIFQDIFKKTKSITVLSSLYPSVLTNFPWIIIRDIYSSTLWDHSFYQPKARS